MLEKLVSVNPTARWWIKGDGTDVIKGLWQSVSGEWSGDVDFNDILLFLFYGILLYYMYLYDLMVQ